MLNQNFKVDNSSTTLRPVHYQRDSERSECDGDAGGTGAGR